MLCLRARAGPPPGHHADVAIAAVWATAAAVYVQAEARLHPRGAGFGIKTPQPRPRAARLINTSALGHGRQDVRMQRKRTRRQLRHAELA